MKYFLPIPWIFLRTSHTFRSNVKPINVASSLSITTPPPNPRKSLPLRFQILGPTPQPFTCQAQDKADKQAAKEAEKARKQADKEEAAEARSVIKKIGDDIKASMVICKRAGMWEVPPGMVVNVGDVHGLLFWMERGT